MSCYCAPIAQPTTHSYFVAMIDYGRRGREAVVNPEYTRRDMVEMIRSGELKNIVFVHEIADGRVTDLTEELQAEAQFEENVVEIAAIMANSKFATVR